MLRKRGFLSRLPLRLRNKAVCRSSSLRQQRRVSQNRSTRQSESCNP